MYFKLYQGPVNQDVFQRNLVVENPKQQDILHESGRYFQDTKHRRFKKEVLGYCTTVSNYCNAMYSFVENYKSKIYLI